MKVSSTPANSPSDTFFLVGSRQSAPTFCQSESVGEPTPTPGIFRISARRPPCAEAVLDAPPTAAAAPMAAAPFSIERRLISEPKMRL